MHIIKVEKFQYLSNFDNCFVVDMLERDGGIALLWHNSLNCNIVDNSSNHVNTDVGDARRGVYRFTGYYGYPSGS